MSQKENLLNRQFGRWTVIAEAECPPHLKEKRTYWLCECSCPAHTQKAVAAKALKSGASQSCGCLQKERTAAAARGNNYGTKNARELTGQKFTHLTAIQRLDTQHFNSWNWLCQCDCGNTHIATARDLLQGRVTRCAECSRTATMSKGEEKIITLLQDANIDFEYQKSFNSCLSPTSDKPLKFDFYIPIKNYLIEFDGEQHFKLSASSAWNNKCATLQERDVYKNQWCKDNNISLIRVPYTHLAQLCLEDLLPETSQFVIS